MNNFLDNIYYRKYRINFAVKRPFTFDGYQFHLLRGVFGMHVRNEVCLKSGVELCNACSENQKCPYTKVFEVKLPGSHPLNRKYTYPPVPYILYPDLRNKTRFIAGEPFAVELTLIGSAIDYDTFLLHCIQRISMGKGLLYKKLECTEIETMVSDDKKSLLRFNLQQETVNQLKLRFDSPVILKIKEEPAKTIPLELLTERLTERLSLLSHLYCGGGIPDIKSFHKQITTDYYIDSFYPVLVEINDGSNKKSPPKESLLGSVAYSGNLSEFMPLIRAGEFLHLGSYSNYGFGKYTIEEAFFV
jgi:hypothetical protein